MTFKASEYLLIMSFDYFVLISFNFLRLYNIETQMFLKMSVCF